MKTIQSLLNEAEVKRKLWEDTSNDPKALADRKIFKATALGVMHYFQGKCEAFREALALSDEGDVE